MSKLLIVEQASAPSAPAAGKAFVYVKTDGRLYWKDSAGVEHKVIDDQIAPPAQFFRKNAVINGDFNIWQRGTSFVSPASNTYCADRWVVEPNGAGFVTVSRTADFPTVAQAGRLFNYSLDIQVTTADATIAAGDNYIIQQRIEGYNWLPLAQRTITLQFWIKAKKTGIYCIGLRNATPDRSYTAEITVSAADTWEKKTVAIVASPSAGTWNYVDGLGVVFSVALACGSTFHTTAGAWQTGNFFATANQVNAMDNVANYVRIAGMQLEAGSVATEFEQRTIQDELELCQRYFEKSFEFDTAPAQNVSSGHNFTQVVGASAVQFSNSIYFKTRKRGAPTITLYNPEAANAQIRNANAAADWSSSVSGTAYQDHFSVEGITPAGSAEGQHAQINWIANAEL